MEILNTHLKEEETTCPTVSYNRENGKYKTQMEE